MRIFEMENVFEIILSEIKPKSLRAGLAILTNILTTVLLYLVFITGLGQLLPRIQFINIGLWILPGIAAYIVSAVAFNLSLRDLYHYSFNSGLIDQIQSTPLLTYQVYFLKSLIILIKSGGHLILTSVVLLIISGVRVHFINLILFWLYLILGLIFISQFGVISGILAAKLKIRSEFVIIFVMALFMLCGVIVPSSEYPGLLGIMIRYFPVTVLFEGGRDLMLGGNISGIYLIYVAGFSIVSYFIAFFIFRQWTRR